MNAKPKTNPLKPRTPINKKPKVRESVETNVNASEITDTKVMVEDQDKKEIVENPEALKDQEWLNLTFQIY